MFITIPFSSLLCKSQLAFNFTTVLLSNFKITILVSLRLKGSLAGAAGVQQLAPIKQFNLEHNRGEITGLL